MGSPGTRHVRHTRLTLPSLLPRRQAKERELELKNTWSESKLSRRQTQAKYGF